jgi:hypothetical protein
MWFHEIDAMQRSSRDNAAIDIMKIRITVPWPSRVSVKAKRFGNYVVQLASNSNSPFQTATIGIVALPTDLKPGEDPAARQMWGLSGEYSTQDEAIYAWENGFEIIPLEQSDATEVPGAVIRAMLAKGLAVGVEE